jgi:hypothetical protein
MKVRLSGMPAKVRRKTTKRLTRDKVVERVITMVTPEEKDAWTQAAIKDGRSVSSFVRLVVNQKVGL